MRVVRDDPAAGFDGYQSFDPQAEEPSAEVDRQAQAIWSMLVHELETRLRQSAAYLLQRHGLAAPAHAIDGCQASLRHLYRPCAALAACLEIVDIYPVIFLLKDHAFPGYWRSEQAQRRIHELPTRSPKDVDTEKQQ